MKQERREKERRQPKALTFVALRPEFIKLGKLMDISSSGLCFEYIAKGDAVPGPEALEMDMFISGNGYYLPNVPCRLVYDVRTERETSFMVGLEYRRCGLQFTRLSEKQMDRLEYYLTHHTAEG
ncbi:MAG: PilZ domain-containing protein [Thermodesulfobacteriota bacterium]